MDHLYTLICIHILLQICRLYISRLLSKGIDKAACRGKETHVSTLPEHPISARPIHAAVKSHLISFFFFFWLS